MKPKTILSLFDYSGNWARPYVDAGHNVMLIDKKYGYDIMDIDYTWLIDNVFSYCESVDAVLAAPPCDDFAVSGAQYWSEKDTDGRTNYSIELVYQVLRIIDACKPDFWAIENPVGRINKLIPELQQFGPWYFQPWWYGDPYTKKTGLWGTFNRRLPLSPVKPEFDCKAGSWIMQLGDKSEKTKELRSITPEGFAKAFYQANCWPTQKQDDRMNFNFVSQIRLL